MIDICRASAGSGKTHKLTGEYIKLLFQSGSESRTNKYTLFRHILAVTFTNKATDEMKQRILTELYNLSNPTAESDYLAAVMEFTGRNEYYVRDHAKNILSEILNDYSAFNISTIDRFFQQTLRAFARELGQYSSYNVEIDEDSVLNAGIDNMMSSLDTEESNDLLKWLIDLSVEEIEKGKTWNIGNKLYSIAKILNKESFRLRSEGVRDRLSDRRLVAEYRDILSDLIKEKTSKLIQLASGGLKIIQCKSLDISDFKNAKNGFERLNKWSKGEMITPTATFLSLEQNVDNWYKKPKSKSDFEGEAKRSMIIEAYHNGLGDTVSDIIKFFEEDYIDYCTAHEISGNISNLGILSDIQKNIREYTKQNNIVLLSETTELLNRIIDGSDTPFIYEKVGTRIDHYMLDEFQDTSILQWRNFKPLLSDSIASGMNNLVVGDEKQSIYRWRGSDWKLLNETIFEDFSGMTVKEQLDSNWRSGEDIISFNNDFFSGAAAILKEEYNKLTNSDRGSMIESVYSGVEQNIPDKRTGYSAHVQLNLVSGSDEETWREEAMKMVVDRINKISDQGYSNGDIALLVRTGKEGARLAEYLLSKGFRIISDDSLFISTSPSVKKVVSVLKGIDDDTDQINKYQLNELNYSSEEHFLYNLCEDIIRSVLNEEERKSISYIQAFLDCVLEYTRREGSNIHGFLEWWDDVADKKALSSPDIKDALRIMTIHKSKGLGFKVVIIPFLEEELFPLKGKTNTIWCRTDKEPFNMIPLVPMDLKKDLLNTHFAEDYKQEMLYSYIDTLNVAYVAFTRAKDELIIFLKDPVTEKSSSYKPNKISNILYSKYFERAEERTIDFGEWTTGSADSKDNTLLDMEPIFPSIYRRDRLKPSLKGVTSFGERSEREWGVILHDILSEIKIEQDLSGVLDKYLSEGIISHLEKSSINSKISRLISSVSDRKWFDDGEFKILNEITIIDTGGSLYRPDRIMISHKEDRIVVIDYKTGQAEYKSYIRQINKYTELLKDIYPDTSVQGYIWYIGEGNIVKV